MSETVKVDGVAVDYSGLPERCRDTMRLYLEHGCDPGSGWRAVLEGDARAVVMVDNEMFHDLRTIWRWLRNYAPSESHGSRRQVEEWMRARGAV